jgi:cytochrome c-type biogenesis protein
LSINLSTALDSSPILAIGIAYFAGLLTSATPCIYPLIPITASIISARNIGAKNKLQSFLLSLTYVLGLSVTYSIIGIISAIAGLFFGSIQNHPLTFLFVGVIITFFGLSMLDIVSLRHITFLEKYLNKAPKKGYFSIFLLGLTSGLIVAPCTAPVLGTLITIISVNKNIIFGSFLMFSFAIGMSTILLIIGTFSGFLTHLPKSGKWLKFIKTSMGVVITSLGLFYIFKAIRVFLSF